MSTTYFDEAYLKLEDELEVIARNENDPLKKMDLSLNVIRNALKTLKEYILTHPFEDKKEEIHFFKKIKPKFYCLMIFEMKVYQIITNVPRSSEEQVRNYYLEELKYIRRALNQNQFQYQYYRLGADELDTLYFVRNITSDSALVPEIPDIDPSFSTSCDYLFSKFMAYEMIELQLEAVLNQPNEAQKNIFIRPGRKLKPLKWTGDPINIVELGYGIWVSDQINHGNAELADIMYWLGASLNIDLTRYTRRFEEVKNRKIISKTRFIDMMSDAIHRHIEKSHAIKPTTLRKAKRNLSQSED
ncbi:RteC domain-containing protein [Mucilaginibacter sp.]